MIPVQYADPFAWYLDGEEWVFCLLHALPHDSRVSWREFAADFGHIERSVTLKAGEREFHRFKGVLDEMLWDDFMVVSV